MKIILLRKVVSNFLNEMFQAWNFIAIYYVNLDLYAFLSHRGESPKSTIGIEYTFGRRSRGANMAKDITHLWELGGGTLLAKLIEIPITAECLKLVPQVQS